jgi:predicted enzyme related to lactoylglutathione lyase
MATQVGIRHMVAVLPATDIERAKGFYEEKLGMTPDMETPEGLYYRAGDAMFFLYPAEGAASGLHTQAALLVDDLDATMADLKSRGVTFEDYDIPTAHTEGGVMDTPEGRGAFFKDSEGNILGVLQIPTELAQQVGL